MERLLLHFAYLKAKVLARSVVTSHIDQDLLWYSSVLANAELEPRFLVAALPKATSKFPTKRSPIYVIKISS
jgi:hypothetical protein